MKISNVVFNDVAIFSGPIDFTLWIQFLYCRLSSVLTLTTGLYVSRFVGKSMPIVKFLKLGYSFGIQMFTDFFGGLC